MSDYLQRQLNKYKEELANLSRRNRELYYKESSGSSVNLSRSQFPGTSYMDGESSAFSPAKVADSQILQLMAGEKELNLHEHFEIEKIKDAAGVKKLYRRIDKIRLSDDKHQREFGISGAWLLGPFLCWKTSNTAAREDMLITPIFKIAIDLKKNKKKHLVLNAENDEIGFNPSLILALKQYFGFTIANDQKFEGIQEALDFFKNELRRLDREVLQASTEVDRVPEVPARYKIIKNEDGEIIEKKPLTLEESLTKQDLDIYNAVTAQKFILIDAVYLDQLNASRMVLIKDYEEIIESGIDHRILNELFNGAVLPEEPSSDRAKLRELDSYKERDNYFVVDIDSTQHRAIDKATKASAIVIQGPPGSGKSQTIVNLIADCLAKGKKVLFVSEKRPALDVVFNRMKSANIDSQAVLIHSSDLNKSDLYKEFLALADTSPCEVSAKEWNKLTDSLDQTKSEMHEYSTALISAHTDSGLQAADLIVAASQTDQSHFVPSLFSKFQSFDFEKVKNFRSEIDLIQNLLAEIADFDRSPWKYRAQDAVRTKSLEYDLNSKKDAFQAIIESDAVLKRLIESEAGEHLQDGEPLTLVSDASPVPESFSALWKINSNEIQKSLEMNLSSLQTIKEKLNKLKISFFSIAKGKERKEIEDLAKYYSVPRGLSDWFSGMFWQMRKHRQAICQQWNGTNSQFVDYLGYLDAFADLEKIHELLGSVGSIQVGHHQESILWIDMQISKVQSIQRFFATADKYLPTKMKSHAANSLEGYNRTIQGLENIKGAFESLANNLTDGFELWSSMSTLLTQLPKADTAQERLEFIKSLIEKLDHLETIDKADMLTQKAAERFGVSLGEIIKKDLSVIKNNWGQVIETTLLNTWVDDLIKKTPALRSFQRERIHTLIEDFKIASESHKVGSREAVHQAFARRWSQGSNRTGVPLLKRESEKQRRVLSPREIMEKGALSTMLQLKPCWLMSPLSISQMLPLQKDLFDVIIFDEASQVRVEDAIPSIYRAASMIVVGDNKQMPPTNFFSGGSGDDDDDDIEIAPSVLDLASQVYPSVLLEWHYRSKSESLIAFSNRAFYGGKLIAAPNPRILTAGGALQFRKVDNGYFTSRDGNVEEAEQIVTKLIKLLKENPDRSYGVIAMGQKQATAIEEAIERRVESSTEASRLFEKAFAFKDGDADAALFVKNLENVQGDERDVIILSVGYAPAGEGKKMRMNFGPLGTKGGGRRLNVAITRAKSQMYVFCSFEPSLIPITEEAFSKNPEACVFGRYLNYAKAVSDENLDQALLIINSFPMGAAITSRKSSRFALDVKRRLEANGHKVSAEIGSSGFYIDLGIHHPVIQSNFALGVECDGAIFHSTPYARDRDKIRENLLRTRGWKIERIWSQDWSRDWQKEIIRIETALLKADSLKELPVEMRQGDKDNTKINHSS